MLRVAVRRVDPAHLDELRAWLGTANGERRDEALATLADEGVRHEQAYLFRDAEGPLLLYVVEVDDLEAAAEAAARSTHPIDAEHSRIMRLAVGADVDLELALDLHP